MIDIRLKNARKELEFIDRFQYLVINDDFDSAVESVKKIVAVEEMKVNRIKKINETFYGG